jgi:cysteine synthase A
MIHLIDVDHSQASLYDLVNSTRGDLASKIALIESAGESDTPIVQLKSPGINLFAKIEHCSMLGSIKDRSALWILKSAIARGDIHAETTIVESSSGNFALALAMLCRLLGIRFIPVIDPNVSALNESVLRTICDTVIKVEERDETGGFLKTRLAKVKAICRSHPDAYWPNQYANQDGMLGHYHLTAGSICRAFSQLDIVFIPVSTGGTVAGVSRRLKEHFPHITIVAVDAEGSVAFGGKPKKRHLSGVGSSIVPELLALAQIDEVVIVPEAETIHSCRELLYNHGLFVGASSGTAYAAVKHFLPRMRGIERPNVMFLCPDRGTAYVDTVYSDDWVNRVIIPAAT